MKTLYDLYESASTRRLAFVGIGLMLLAVVICIAGCTPPPPAKPTYGDHWFDMTIALRDYAEFALVCQDGRIVGNVWERGGEWDALTKTESYEFDNEAAAASWVEKQSQKEGSCAP